MHDYFTYKLITSQFIRKLFFVITAITSCFTYQYSATEHVCKLQNKTVETKCYVAVYMKTVTLITRLGASPVLI